VTVFIYEDEEARQLGQDVTPKGTTAQAAWHIVTGEEIGWQLAATLPAYAYELETESSLLRTGVATALTADTEELIEGGCELLSTGKWTPLWQLGFGGLTAEQLRIESGLMVRYLVDLYGWDIVSELWRATARLGGGMSLDAALLECTGMSRREIQTALVGSVLDCD
jgi:hypothetical protein